MKRWWPAALITALVAAGVPASAQTEPVEELTVGEWQGGAEAWGTAQGSQGGTSIEWSARIVSTFTFTVVAGGENGEGSIEGEFDLRSEGLLEGDQMQMTATSGGQSFTAEWDINEPAGGSVGGTRREVVFDSEPMTTTATVMAAGQSIRGQGAPSEVVITNDIGYLACDHAIGNWDVSISQDIEGEGWTPSFSGYWAAVPVLDPETLERPQTPQEEFIDGLDELFADYREFEASVGTSLGPDPTYDPTQLSASALLDLVGKATELMNTLHNLTRCDAESIGTETLQEWQTALAGVVGDLVLTAADRLAVQDGLFLSYASVQALVTAADGTNAYLGEGESFQVTDALAEIVSKSIEGHLRFSRGEGLEPCDMACRNDQYLWAAGAVALATTHGWPITVEGETYAPEDAPSVLGDPPEESS